MKEVMEFICGTTCLFAGTLWKEDDILEWEDPIESCKACNGSGCKKCGDTGRGVPPYHFIPYNRETEKAAADQKKNAVEAETKRLREEIKALGFDFDTGWSVEKLRNQLYIYKQVATAKAPFVPYKNKAEAQAKAIEAGLKNVPEKSLKELNEELEREHNKET